MPACGISYFTLTLCGTSGVFLFVPLEAVDVRMPAASSGVNGALVTMSVNSCSSLWKCSFARRYLSVELKQVMQA